MLYKGKPVFYASKTLTPRPEAYGQIEKEALLLVLGCQKIHQFRYGVDFVAETAPKLPEIIM